MNENKPDYDRGSTISLSGSDITWDDVDKRADFLGYGKMRSRYVQYAIKKEMISGKKLTFRDVILFSLLMTIFTVQILMILGAFNG